MNIKPLFAWFTLILFMTGCRSMKVTTEQEQDFDFGQVRTFQWIDGPRKILDEADTYIHEDMQKALQAELMQRGLQPVTEAADIQVAYYVKLREEIKYTDSGNPDAREFSGGFVYDRDAKGWNYAEREPDLNVYTIEMGTLTVLIYDHPAGNRVWRGTLQTEIDRSLPEEKQAARILAAAEKLMSRLPATSR